MLVAQEFLDKPDVEYKLVVDHIDHNTINNQVTNLRYVSMTQNSMNKSKNIMVPPYVRVFVGIGLETNGKHK
jgi:hypothetical protein